MQVDTKEVMSKGEALGVIRKWRIGVWLLCVWCFVPVWAASEAADESAAQEPAPQSVEEILTREPSAEDYTQMVDCIPNHRIRSIEVLDDKHVAFRMSGDEYYLVQFKHRCPGLRRNKPVITEPRSNSRYCAMDGLRATHEGALGDLSPGMYCSIPGFQPVTKEQIVLLKDTLRVERRKKRSPSDDAPQSPKDNDQDAASAEDS